MKARGNSKAVKTYSKNTLAIAIAYLEYWPSAPSVIM